MCVFARMLYFMGVVYVLLFFNVRECAFVRIFLYILADFVTGDRCSVMRAIFPMKRVPKCGWGNTVPKYIVQFVITFSYFKQCIFKQMGHFFYSLCIGLQRSWLYIFSSDLHIYGHSVWTDRSEIRKSGSVFYASRLKSRLKAYPLQIGHNCERRDK